MIELILQFTSTPVYGAEFEYEAVKQCLLENAEAVRVLLEREMFEGNLVFSCPLELG